MPLSFLLSNRLIALPLRNRNFGTYTLGSSPSLMGMWMQRIAIGWLAWRLTGSGVWLGILSFSDFFPVVLVGPIAGAVADRLDRLMLVKTCQTIAMMQATVLCVLTITGHINIGLLVGLTAFQGMVTAFNQPSRLALVPSLVPAAEIGGAVAINSVVFNLARFVGPILAGVAIVWGGIASAFAANAISYGWFLLMLARIKLDNSNPRRINQRSFIADFKEGIHYTANHPGIGALLLLLVALGLGGRPLNELLPGFADSVFHSGAKGLSIMASSIGAGAIIGGLWVGQRAHSNGLTWVALGSSLTAALAAVISIATHQLWAAVPALIVYGFGMSTAGIAIQTAIQVATDTNMRGRVMGLYGLIWRGSPALGALSAGAASAHFGLRLPIVFGALLVAAVWVWTYLSRARISAAMEQPNADAA